MDQQALLGTGGFFDPAAASQPLTPQADPSAATTYPEWAAILGMTVDGRRSANPSEGGLVMDLDGYNDADKLYRGGNSPESIAERITRVSKLAVSAAMPAADSNVVSMLVVRGSTPAAIQPVWPGLSIEDIYTDSGTGLVSFVAIALAAFSVQDISAYAWVKINNS